MNNILIQEHYSVEDCLNNPRHLYIFGDNLIKQGKGGQAIIRDCPNAFGIPTKRYPDNEKTSFFSDKPDEVYAVETTINRLNRLTKTTKKYNVIVFPYYGLGTGLAKMPECSPLLYKIMLAEWWNWYTQKI